ncbi:glutamine-rich protein 2 [Petaurus breviceps papuanus]|uniref:glutamine-rich protein 2 n=1 Tax=Petaurus breviceps papuanus TaxID=3040969 RepID=UPI0036D7DFB5
MPAKITLGELVDLSIGTPEIGAVNFNALHTLLAAMLKHLNLQDIKIELPPQVTEQSRSIESIRASTSGTPGKEKRKVSISKQPSSGRLTPQVIEAHVKDLGGQVQDLGKQVQAIGNQVQGIESHVQDIGSQVDVFGEQIAALDKLPSGTDLLEKTPSGSRVSDIWQMMQMKKKVEANEDGISKAMGLIQDVMNEVKELKADQEKGPLRKDFPQALEPHPPLSQSLEPHSPISLPLKPHPPFNLFLEPHPSITLFLEPHPLICQVLEPQVQISPSLLIQSLVSQPAPGQDQRGVPLIPQQPTAGIPGSDQPGLVASGTALSGEQPTGQAGTQRELPSDAQPGFVPYSSYASRHPSFVPFCPPYMPPQPSAVPQAPWASPYSGTPYQYRQSPCQRDKVSLDRQGFSFPFALETLRLMGELTNYYLILKEQMGALDEDAGHSELEKLQFLIGKLTCKTFPDDMLEQLRGLKALTKEIQEEREKMKLMQRILEGEEEDAEEERERSGHLSLQLSILRVNVNDIEKELALLRERQEQGKAIVEQSVTEATLYLQEQLDKLRMIIESMLTSSSTLLSMSMAPSKTPAPLDPGKVDPHTTCPACSLDLSQQVSRLVQRYEQLQEMVNNLMVSRPSRKYQQQNQDEELLGHIQATILQVQGDCEKLNITTGNLIEDHRQKQKDIDVLYQSLEKLEKEKANREHLEMEIDVKADKTALAAKVSRIQFDATTEQLNQMMQDLLTKMTGQEKDWKKVLDKLLVEMDTKLDRLELDPVKKMLEERWKALRKQLKEQSPLYQSDEAATMRRQLLAHFHCLSCDRPLETAVPGPIIPSVPSGPGLPAHRSNRPYTIYELEQVRQQSRNMRLGTAFQRMELGQLERSVGRLHSMHSKMLMDIEKVQIHFGGSVKASSQMIRELIQAQCLGSSYYKRIQDMPDYSYMSVPRRCGGSHTLTFPYRRYARLQHLAQCVYPTEDVQASLKHEVDILGLDGHIYKGRLDTRLPGIPNKESTTVRGPSPEGGGEKPYLEVGNPTPPEQTP